MKIYPLHPMTLTMLAKGHPWITKDTYSEKFPKKQMFLELYHPQNKSFLGVFLHDPQHPHVRARFWDKKISHFEQTLNHRLEQAFEKRKSFLPKRQALYLIFDQADFLPGLFIQKLGTKFLIQYTAFYWENYLDKIIHFLKNNMLTCNSIWVQKRVPGEQKKPPQHLFGPNKPNEIILENDINYQLCFDLGHDIGVYCDMMAIREKLFPLLKNNKSMLNLFSYTGAFTLPFLKYFEEVVSVDVSKEYMNWLESNCQLNQLDLSKHQSLVMSCEKAIQKLSKLNKTFDVIICDPPSFSSDGKKKSTALNFYKNNFSLLTRLLSKNGKLILFLNTHNFPRQKFKSTFKELLKKHPHLSITQEYFMTQDCPIAPHFPEGDYLKGLMITSK